MGPLEYPLGVGSWGRGARLHLMHLGSEDRGQRSHAIKAWASGLGESLNYKEGLLLGTQTQKGTQCL